jgi:hypothetical protein
MISLMVPFTTFSFLGFLSDLLQKSISVASSVNTEDILPG